MSKYTKEQLQSIARDALQAHEAGDSRFIDRMLMLICVTDLSPDQCMERIRRIAETGEV